MIDLKISRHVTEYRAEIITDQDGNSYFASFPENVTRPAQYSVDVKAHAVYMSQYQLIPYGRTAQQINDASEISISTGSIYNFNCEAYNMLADFQKWLITTQTEASVLHADETGANINGKNHWLHSLSNEVSTYFHSDENMLSGRDRNFTALDFLLRGQLRRARTDPSGKEGFLPRLHSRNLSFLSRGIDDLFHHSSLFTRLHHRVLL